MPSLRQWKDALQDAIQKIVENPLIAPHQTIQTNIRLPKAGRIRVGIEFERHPTQFLKLRLAYALEPETAPLIPNDVPPAQSMVLSRNHSDSKKLITPKITENLFKNKQKIANIKNNMINKYLEITQPLFQKNINGIIDIIADKNTENTSQKNLVHLPLVLKNIAQTPALWTWEDPKTNTLFQHWHGTVPNQPNAHAHLSLMELQWEFPEANTPPVKVHISHAALHKRLPLGANKP